MSIKFLLLGTSLSLIPTLTNAQCSPAQSCAELGYKETANKGGCLKCPFGNGWYCPEPKEKKAVLGECTGYAKNCKIADILNSDGTCTTDKVSDKTPIGVVVAIKDNCGWVMTAFPVQTEIAWGGNGIDILSLPNYSSREEAMTDYDACGNTLKIIETGTSSSYPAAYAAINYSPSTAISTKGKWCVPSAGMFFSLNENLDKINSAMSKIGGKPTSIYGAYESIWSSTEASAEHAWGFCIDECQGLLTVSKHYDTKEHVVRPVLPF